jgi:hypothetical protein
VEHRRGDTLENGSASWTDDYFGEREVIADRLAVEHSGQALAGGGVVDGDDKGITAGRQVGRQVDPIAIHQDLP